MIVTCTRCLTDWHLTELGSGVVSSPWGFVCWDEAACDTRAGAAG